jgi:hypothetical protein
MAALKIEYAVNEQPNARFPLVRRACESHAFFNTLMLSSGLVNGDKPGVTPCMSHEAPREV